MTEEDFKINAGGGASAAPQEFSGDGEQKQEVKTQADGGGEQVGGGGGGGSIPPTNDAENRDEDQADDTSGEAKADPVNIELGKDTLVPHDHDLASGEEQEQKEPVEINPDLVDEALETAIDSQVPLEVNANLLTFVAGDRVKVRAKGHLITIDVIAMDNSANGDECVGENQSDSDWLKVTAMLPCGCYVKFLRQNVVEVL